jgi:DNA-binding MarR family transcriptional regulator
LKKTQELGRLVASECLAVRVRRLGRVVTRIYDRALAPHGVSTAQFNLLAAVAATGGARPVDLAALLDVEKSTLSRDLERMRRLGWVHSKTGVGGTRLVALTASGGRLLVSARRAWEAAQAAAVSELGSGNVDRLRRALPSPVSRWRHR